MSINKQPLGSAAAPGDQKQDLAGWPQWIRDALAGEPVIKPESGEISKAATDPRDVRILRRVTPR